MSFNKNKNKIYNMNSFYKSAILIFFLITLGISYYFYKTSTFVTAEFKNLRPFHYRAPVYYNGFKIGKVIKIKPNKSYTATIVTLWLHPHDLKLPTNITVLLKKECNKNGKKFDYIDIIYPKTPSGFYLKDGDRIAGKTTVELETYLANQDVESLEAIKRDFTEAVKSLNITIQTLGDLFETLNSMTEEVRPNMVKTSINLSNTTDNFVELSKNINLFSDNINTAFNQKRINTTAKNIQAISKNLKTTTNEFNKTLPELQNTICESNKIVCNIDKLTSGINCTMQKPFGGLRLIFGSPISKNKCK